MGVKALRELLEHLEYLQGDDIDPSRADDILMDLATNSGYSIALKELMEFWPLHDDELDKLGLRLLKLNLKSKKEKLTSQEEGEITVLEARIDLLLKDRPVVPHPRAVASLTKLWAENTETIE